MEPAQGNRFGAFPETYAEFDKSLIAILPVPFDLTSTWLKGADRGPDAILDASRYLETYDIDTGTEVYLHGIHTCSPVISGDDASMVRDVRASVSSLIENGKFVVTLGGEHSISIGAAHAHSQAFEELTVLQLDAHTDLREIYKGNRNNHACTMARIRDEVGRTVSVGIRSMDSSELRAVSLHPVFYADDIRRKRNWISSVVRALGKNVYVTIDVDVFENGIMPSTGTPEPGGLGWYEVIDLLRVVAARRNIVGFDVAELCPSKNRAPDFLVAKLIYQFLSYIFYYKSKNKPRRR
jgi:agmatinase